MSKPDPRDAETAALRREIAELRARLAKLEDIVRRAGAVLSGGPPQQQQQQQQMRRPDKSDYEQSQGAEPPETNIEPFEPWGLKPPGPTEP